MGRNLRRGVLFTLLFAGLVAPAAADPLLLLLLGIARDMVIDQAQKSPKEKAIDDPFQPDMSKVYPGTSVEPETLRRLIDDSYSYLSSSQRQEIFEALNAELMNPKNAAMRGAYIEYFADRALTWRAAQMQLAQMPYHEKQRLAEEFKSELPSMPEEEQAKLGKLLRSGMLPVPNDLNQLLLAAFEAR
jgi:hypothetical protein